MNATTVVDSPSGLLALDGAELGTTDWAEVTQDQVGLFAEATGDHQQRSRGGTGVARGGIHVDVARARAESPFGGPIAHGYLTLSLVNLFLPQLLEVRGASMGVNVGLDQVRFPAPVPVGSRLRGSGRVVAGRRGEGRHPGHRARDRRGRGLREARLRRGHRESLHPLSRAGTRRRPVQRSPTGTPAQLAPLVTGG